MMRVWVLRLHVRVKRWGIAFALAVTPIALSSIISLSAQGDPNPTLQPSDLLQQASAAYTARDFPQAIQHYEAYLATFESGYIPDPAVYFNLGNAYFEAGDLGHALLNYRRAQRLIPRDADLNRNLALTRALRVDVQGEDRALIDSLAAATEGILTRDELALMVFSVWVSWCAVGGMWLARPPMRSRLRLLWLVITPLLVGGGVLFAGRVYVETLRPPAVVTAFQTEMMSGAGESYVPLFTLYAAAEGRVIEQRGAWVRFLLPDERQGWLPTADVTLIRPTP